MDSSLHLRIPVLGLGSGGAGVLTLERALAAVPGVRSVSVNPETETADVRADAASVDAWTLMRVIHRAGYHAGKPTES
ncbi:MAG: heavy-metal-associated domain-containing protein [Candidatus Limnocylindrales bacterium]